MSNTLNFRLGRSHADAEISLSVMRLVIAGWTGRDRQLVDKHIAELAKIGVKPPQSAPVFYRCTPTLLTANSDIDVIGQDSSGEVEFFVLSLADGLYVGVGSDHTDRKVEVYDITVSKQMCPKPVGRDLWRLSDVATHWDTLVLRAYYTRNGTRSLYQEGPVSSVLKPADLIRRYTGGAASLPIGTLMFCGTLPVIGGVAGGERFDMALVDPVMDRSIEHGYNVHTLPSVE